MWQEIGIIISLTITTIGAIFVVYDRFTKPDIKNDQTIALLSQKAELTQKENDRKFIDFSKRLDDAFTLASNHTHTVDVKVDKLIETTNNWHLAVSQQLTEISTIMSGKANKKNC
jgi:ribosome assembly protein YihI (activator of Der GTPase)